MICIADVLPVSNNVRRTPSENLYECTNGYICFLMRFLKADYIFPVSSAPIKNGIISIEDDGTVIEIIEDGKKTQEPRVKSQGSKIEIFRGIICPGFVNAHCHLELSHLENKLTPGKGLPHFIKEIARGRNAPDEEIKTAIEKAEEEMIAEGIVAVGDISNTNHSFEQKKKGKLRYHTFIEIFDLVPERAEEKFENGLQLLRELNDSQIRNPKSEIRNFASIVPHAPYTVSTKLLKLINDFADAEGSVLCIHNEETSSENEMFLERKGELFETLSSFGDYYKNWKATGLPSLASTLVHLPKCNKMQLVHNTYTTSEDITWSHLYSMMVWWCTCPRANLFIENKIPDYKIFIDAGCRMTVGTDSYASNWSLSILEELKTISKHASYVTLETLIRWSTLNGAEFLGFEKETGSIEKGKIPGLNLITNINFETLKLTDDSEIKKLI